MSEATTRWTTGLVPGAGRVARVAAAAVLGVALSACSIAIPSLVADPAETTGSIGTGFRSPLSPDLSVEDWRRAKAALAVALDPQGNGSSVGWDNPESGFRGTFVPVGGPFVQSDLVCRAFVATVRGAGDEPFSLQGTACRAQPDEWEVSGVKAWRKPV